MDVADVAWARPIADGLNLRVVHFDAVDGADKTEEFDRVAGKLAFVGRAIQAIGRKSSQDFFDVIFVIGGVDRKD